MLCGDAGACRTSLCLQWLVDGDSTKGDVVSKARKIEDNEMLENTIPVFSAY